ncbi:MAG TPA: BTAD domain-containing putative transcriptional regulator [Longimicrobiales bacterium]
MIRLYTLAGIDLRGPDGRPLRSVLAQPKRFALLVHLVLTARTATGTRDGVLGLFWPESAPDRARRALNQSLHYLRRSLGPGVIVSQGAEGVGIADGALWCDAIEFQDALAEGRLAEAMALYRADLLAGFYIDDAPGFERWLEDTRSRLREGARAAVRELTERDLAANDFPRALHWARLGVELAPHDEGAFRDLIRVLDRSGDRAGALDVFESLSQRLDAEFGVAPAPETLALIAAVRSRREAEPAAAAEPRDRTAAAPGEAPGAPVPPPPGDASGAGPGAPGPYPGAPLSDAAETPEATRGGAIDPAIREHPAADGPVTTEREPRRRRRLTGRPAAAIIALALAGAFLLTLGPDADAPPRTDEMPDSMAAADPALPRIAVLPFRDLGDDGELQTLADALSLALASRLAQVPGLEVISSRSLPDTNPGDPHVRNTASVRTDVCVAGSVLGSADSIMIQVELIDAASRVTLWNTRIGRPSGDLFALVDDVSADLTSALRVRLGQWARSEEFHHHAASIHARELVRQALRHRDEAAALKRAGAPSSAIQVLRAADSLLAEAEYADSSWVDPIVLRGWTAAERGWIFFDPPFRDFGRTREAWMQSLAHATRALARAPRDAKALELRGVLRYWLWLLTPPAETTPTQLLASAETDLERAVAIDSRRIRAWSGLASILDARGDFAEANVAAQYAYEADAYLENPQQILSILVKTSLELRDDADARRWCDELRRQSTSSAPAAYCTLSILAWSVAPPDVEPGEIWRIIDGVDPERAARSIVRPRLEMLAAIILARIGMPDSARAVLQRAHESAGSDPEVLWLEAAAMLQLGESDRAARLLTRYVQANPAQRERIRRSRIFTPLHDRLWRPAPLDRPGAPAIEPWSPPDHVQPAGPVSPGRPVAPAHQGAVTDSRSTAHRSVGRYLDPRTSAPSAHPRHTRRP